MTIVGPDSDMKRPAAGQLRPIANQLEQNSTSGDELVTRMLSFVGDYDRGRTVDDDVRGCKSGVANLDRLSHVMGWLDIDLLVPRRVSEPALFAFARTCVRPPRSRRSLRGPVHVWARCSVRSCPYAMIVAAWGQPRSGEG